MKFHSTKLLVILITIISVRITEEMDILGGLMNALNKDMNSQFEEKSEVL
jgi:hypothetical protein